MEITYEMLSECRPKRERKHAARVMSGLIPDQLIDDYIAERKILLGDTPKWRSGWDGPTPYLWVKSMKNLALYKPLMEALEEEIGEEMGLHLCLTGFESTQRNWHMDGYLNPPFVGDKYLAVWIALDDILPGSGPFHFVPGSEQWPVITRDKVWAFAPEEMKNTKEWNTQWPTLTQDFVSKACEKEIWQRGAEVVSFTGKKGDVLIWDSDLIHRGSKPTNPGLERRALICHYSALSVRPDMPERRKHDNGKTYFWFPHGLY